MITRKWLALISGLLACAFVAPLSARVLDNFDAATRSGWQDFKFSVGVDYATITQSGGQLKFSLIPAGRPIFAASTKTSETFELKEGRTIEFRVDLVSGNGKDAFAVLAFIPTSSSAQSLNGYGFAKSTTDILVTKSLDKYFYNQNPATPIKNDNVTLSLSLAVRNGSVFITSRVLDKDANNAVIFEKTFVDTPAADVLENGTDNGPPYLGAGNFVLYCYEDDGKTQDSYEVTFDNAEVFVTETTLLDDFNDNQRTDWQDFAFNVGVKYANITEENGQMKFSLIPVGRSIFAASTKTTRSFNLVEGERVELSVDMVSGNGPDAFAVLAFIPDNSSAQSLNGYGMAKSSTDILVTKSLDKYFYNQNPATPIKNENITLDLALEVRNGSVYINARVLDKDASDAVLFEKSFIDTPQVDVLDDGTDNGPPYIGSGHFVLYCYEDNGKTQDSYEVVFDNARVAAAPLAANTPPAIADISPASTANFLPASSTLTFTVRDDKPLPANGIRVTLNGNVVTNLTVSGPADARVLSLSGFQPETSYTAKIEVTDSEGLKTESSVYFDTFSTNDFVIEVEDYNFGGGQFINNPAPLVEGSGPQPSGYANQAGIKDTDFSDTRTDLRDVPYRPEDNVRMQRSLDLPRQKFLAAGGPAASVYDYDVGDIAAGEWLNYTRDFQPGAYAVYLREALRNGTQVETALEEVTSDPTQPNQSTRPLGSFFATSSGFLFRNVPLTDALGRPITLNLSGRKTLRLRQVQGDPPDGSIYQNYLVFVPVAASGPQRATVSSVSPAAGSTIETLAPVLSASILNRDTSVKNDSVKLFINGGAVNASVTATDTGASLSYALTNLPPSGSVITARIEFADSANVVQTNEWTFTISYKSLDPAHRAGAPGNRGLNVRFVQAPSDAGPLENSLLRAEDQLAPNSTIPKVVDATNVVQVINFNQAEADAGTIPGDVLVPGLDPDQNGTEDFAVEITAYLDLAAGAHRFGVVSDDGFKLTSGTSLSDRTSTPLDFHSGGPANQTVDFYVPQAGLYPFRLVWYERGGGANVEWFSVNPSTGEKTLINDPSSSAAVKAYVTAAPPAVPTVRVESASVVNGPYAAEPGATVNTGTGTIAIPLSTTGNRFFRLNSTGPLRITSVRIGDAGGGVSSVLLSYQAN